MSRWARWTALLVIGCTWGADAADTGPVLDQAARAAHDTQRLAAARARHGADASQLRAADARRAQQRQLLQTLERQLAASVTAQQQLSDARDRAGQDLRVLHAVARSAIQEQLQRLRHGPLGAGDEQAINDATALLRAPASLDTLYGVWFALFGELAHSAVAAGFRAPVTRLDGIRQTTAVTRYGAVALAADDRELAHDPARGLFELPTHAASDQPVHSRQFAAQQIYDSGFIGALLLGCALLGAAVVAAQCGRLAWLVYGRAAPVRSVPDSDRYLTVIGSAALLLGLLGTIVGLIHTFRGLALYGGADTRLAAAGISHALATTWMGLSIAIPLALVQGAVRAWRRRVARQMVHVDATPPRARAPAAAAARARAPARTRSGARAPLFLACGAALTCALFFLMQWLTLRPLGAPDPAPAPVPVTRIDWTVEPPPPPLPRERERSTTADSASAVASLSLPPLEPPSTAAPSFAMPALAVTASLLGAADGGAALVATGEQWVLGAGDSGFRGSDLIPISSARPKYPRAAAADKIAGWVELIFTISADGTVSNVRVIDAEPPGVFELAAASAMRRWLYAPLYRDGKPVIREATQLFRFRPEDIDEQYLYDRD